ncbi:MAG: hypothetical protein ACI3VM_09205 [Oscillospiraceae bacterium]
MTGETAIEIINAICDKIGIVYDKAVGLVPYIVRYNIARNLAWIFAGAAMAGVGVFLIHAAEKKAAEYNEQHKNDEYPENRTSLDYIECMVGAPCLGIAGFLLLVFGGSLIMWLVAPEISALQWALKLIGGN